MDDFIMSLTCEEYYNDELDYEEEYERVKKDLW